MIHGFIDHSTSHVLPCVEVHYATPIYEGIKHELGKRGHSAEELFMTELKLKSHIHKRFYLNISSQQILKSFAPQAKPPSEFYEGAQAF